jgi:hypothetical protein
MSDYADGGDKFEAIWREEGKFANFEIYRGEQNVSSCQES